MSNIGTGEFDLGTMKVGDRRELIDQYTDLEVELTNGVAAGTPWFEFTVVRAGKPGEAEVGDRLWFCQAAGASDAYVYFPNESGHSDNGMTFGADGCDYSGEVIHAMGGLIVHFVHDEKNQRMNVFTLSDDGGGERDAMVALCRATLARVEAELTR